MRPRGAAIATAPLSTPQRTQRASLDETPSPDIILVPGGMSTFEHAQDQKVLDWVRSAHETAGWTSFDPDAPIPPRDRVGTYSDRI